MKGKGKTLPLSRPCIHIPDHLFPRPLRPFPPPMSSSDAHKTTYASGRNPAADGFYTMLLSSVHSAAPDLPLDPVVFRSLLLCVLAPGVKNLLLRSYDEDISLVQNVTALVSPGPDPAAPPPARVYANATYQPRRPIGDPLIIINLDSI